MNDLSKVQIIRRHFRTKAQLQQALELLGIRYEQDATISSLEKLITREQLLSVLSRLTLPHSSQPTSLKRKRSSSPIKSSSSSLLSSSRSHSLSTKQAKAKNDVEWRKYDDLWHDYQKIRELGRGKFGSVFLVRRKSDEAMFALKILLSQVVVKKEEIEDDVQILQTINRSKNGENVCPEHVVCYIDHFLTPKGEYALLMNLVPGKDMQIFMEEKRKVDPDWQPSPKQAQSILKDILKAVAELHQKRVAHRDIKPANIIISEDGLHATIADFGLACIASKGASKLGCSNSETVNFGTPCYTHSPERYNMIAADRPNAEDMMAADVWAIGMSMVAFLGGDRAQRICALSDQLEGANPITIETALQAVTKCYQPPNSFYSPDAKLETLVKSFFKPVSQRPTPAQALQNMK